MTSTQSAAATASLLSSLDQPSERRLSDRLAGLNTPYRIAEWERAEREAGRLPSNE